MPLLLPLLVGGCVLPSPAASLPSLAAALQRCQRRWRRQAAALGLVQPLHRACGLRRDAKAHVMVRLLSQASWQAAARRELAEQKTKSPNLAPWLAVIAMMHPAVAGWLCGVLGSPGNEATLQMRARLSCSAGRQG